MTKQLNESRVSAPTKRRFDDCFAGEDLSPEQHENKRLHTSGSSYEASSSVTCNPSRKRNSDVVESVQDVSDCEACHVVKRQRANLINETGESDLPEPLALIDSSSSEYFSFGWSSEDTMIASSSISVSSVSTPAQTTSTLVDSADDYQRSSSYPSSLSDSSDSPSSSIESTSSSSSSSGSSSSSDTVYSETILPSDSCGYATACSDSLLDPSSPFLLVSSPVSAVSDSSDVSSLAFSTDSDSSGTDGLDLPFNPVWVRGSGDEDSDDHTESGYAADDESDELSESDSNSPHDSGYESDE